jgi:hypothetical protein
MPVRLAVRQAMRKVLSRQVPEASHQLQREVADQIVNQTLLLDEAKRRGIQPRRSEAGGGQQAALAMV